MSIACALFLVLNSAIPATAYTVDYTYDDAGRLVAVIYGDDRFIDYRYDAAGNRLSRLAGTALAGNVHPDTVVDLKDAVLVLQIVDRLRPRVITARGDVNGDGVIGMAEAVYILQVVALPGD